MPAQIRPDDRNLTWQGVISLQHTGGWTMPWRLPYESLGLFPSTLSSGSPSKMLQERAGMPAGARLSFRSDTQSVAGYVDAVEEVLGHRPILRRLISRLVKPIGPGQLFL